jgi:hypothetical protein
MLRAGLAASHLAAARGWDGLHQSRFPVVHALHGPPPESGSQTTPKGEPDIAHVVPCTPHTAMRLRGVAHYASKLQTTTCPTEAAYQPPGSSHAKSLWSQNVP